MYILHVLTYLSIIASRTVFKQYGARGELTERPKVLAC